MTSDPELLFVLVLFPPDIADRTSPPSLCPMSQIGDGVLRAATQALRLRGDFQIFDFAFRHSQGSFNNDANLSIVPHAVNLQDDARNHQRPNCNTDKLLDGHTRGHSRIPTGLYR